MFWLSYEYFSILCNAFLLKSAISSSIHLYLACLQQYKLYVATYLLGFTWVKGIFLKVRSVAVASYLARCLLNSQLKTTTHSCSYLGTQLPSTFQLEIGWFHQIASQRITLTQLDSYLASYLVQLSFGVAINQAVRVPY